MRSRIFLSAVAAALLFAVAAAAAPDSPYLDDDALTAALKLMDRNASRASVTSLATTPGGRDLPLLTIAPKDEDGSAAQAVLVVADPLGEVPLATAAALDLARRVLAGDAPARALGCTWYVVPRLDPDGAARLHGKVRAADGRDGRPVDDDDDGRIDEDGPDDLDGDGLITTMLLEDPDGDWLLTDDATPLPRKAEPARGESGLYLKLVEGRDDDGDRAWNEDPPGGVIPGRNFPHEFEHWTPENGPWPASEPESRALLAFAFAHPEIAMILVFGASNDLATPPTPPQGAAAGPQAFKPPRWLAREIGLDTQTTYPLDDLVVMARQGLNMPQLTPEDMLGMLDLGPAVSPDPRDLPWWKEMSRQYDDALKAAGLAGKRADAAPSGSGSVEAWAYYQFGVPAFAVDFWTPPLPADADSTAGAEKPGSGKPGAGKPDEAPKPDPALAALADFAAAHPQADLWRPWKRVELPDGRAALVGGPAPGALRTPPAAMVDSLLAGQVPALLALPDWLPRLASVDLESEARGGDVWLVTARVRNDGRLPYPTAQGRRTRRPPPVAFEIAGAEVLEGPARHTLDAVPALGVAETKWLVRAKKNARVDVTASAPGFGEARASLALSEEGGRR